ncbi:MAG: hypothetical protein VXW65_08355 [Pseudomonadota bacterium]|nr:hypothetical protein [Pseudomonadota bacterium]
MVRLATQAELDKLARVLDVSVEELTFMQHMPVDALRHLRLALVERLLTQNRLQLQWLVRWAVWLPVWLCVLMARYWLDAALTANIANRLPAKKVNLMAQHLPVVVLAEVAGHLEPRTARELLRLLAPERIVAIARVLLQHRDYMTMGRFVGLLSDTVISRVAAAIEHESDLLEIAFYIESTERLDHLVQVLPEARIRRALLLISDPTKRAVWPKLLALMNGINYGLKRRLGDLAVRQGEGVLSALVDAAQEYQLWVDLLAVVADLSPEAQRQVANLAVLQQPMVISNIIQAADEGQLWTDILVMLGYMQESNRVAVAQAMATASDQVLAHVFDAGMLRGQWPVILDIVRRLPQDQQQRCQVLLRQYVGRLDQQTINYLQQLLDQYHMTLLTTHQAMPS